MPLELNRIKIRFDISSLAAGALPDQDGLNKPWHVSKPKLSLSNLHSPCLLRWELKVRALVAESFWPPTLPRSDFVTQAVSKMEETQLNIKPTNEETMQPPAIMTNRYSIHVFQFPTAQSAMHPAMFHPSGVVSRKAFATFESESDSKGWSETLH